jgi:hypothetical protein
MHTAHHLEYLARLITFFGFISKVPNAFIRMTSLNSSVTLLGILREEGAFKEDSTLSGRVTIYIYDTPVETEVDLVVFQIKPVPFDRIRGRRCTSLQILLCSQRQTVGQLLRIIAIKIYNNRENQEIL